MQIKVRVSVAINYMVGKKVLSSICVLEKSIQKALGQTAAIKAQLQNS